MSLDIRSKDQVFYIPLERRPPTQGCRELLHKYSKIPSDKVNEHISKVRDLAWDVHPYPSIGVLLFLDLGVSGDDLPSSGPSSPVDYEAVEYIKTAYDKIVKKLQSGGKFLDIGCMFAQDLRKLVHDGAPVESVYGTDLRKAYFEHGYELFKDEAIIPRDHFIEADILDTKSQGLKFLERKLDVINSTHVIHVFTYEDQILFIKRMIEMLKDEKGTMIIGRMTGNDEAGYHAPQGGSAARVTTKSGGSIWEHNAESFRELWERVAEETGTKWDLKCWLVSLCFYFCHQANCNLSGNSRLILRFRATQAGFGPR